MTRFVVPIALLIGAIAVWSFWIRYASHATVIPPEVLRITSARVEIATLSPPRPEVRRVAEVELPLHWDVLTAGASGAVTVTASFPAQGPVAARSLGLLVERIGVAFEIALNGHVIASGGRLDERDRFYAKAPVHLLLPGQFLVAGDNQLVFRLRADAGYRAGLAPLLIGPTESIDALARRAKAWRVDIPLAASAFSGVVGLFCLLLWWQQRDPLYAWAGLGELLWAITVADAVVEEAPLPWPWWGLALLLIRAVWSLSLYGIAEQVFGRGPVLERAAILVTQATAPMASIAMLLTQGTRPLLAWYAVSFSVWGFILVRLSGRIQREASLERVVVWVATFMVILASGRDVWAARVAASGYAESASAKYLAPLVGLALMWIVAQRFRSARDSVVELNATLTARVEQREAELRESFMRLAETERQRAALAERQRILRDMHDGVGAHLATAVRQLEAGQASQLEVAHSLRDSLTQLKLSIDAMSLPPGDVNALLASLRFRLEPRIVSTGLALHWEVEALPVWTPASARVEDAMRELQYLLLEAISNVFQHAKATSLSFAARTDPQEAGAIEIDVVDDGIGPGSAAGDGPRSLRQRAAAIGASLVVAPADAKGRGTRVRVRLPRLPRGSDASGADYPAAGVSIS